MADKTNSIALIRNKKEMEIINGNEHFTKNFDSYEEVVQWLIKHSFYFKQRTSDEEIWTLNSRITTVFV